jgi:transposase-like protein
MLSFKRHRFPPAIITSSIWLYARFTLSLRDVEEVFAERGLDVSYETVRPLGLEIRLDDRGQPLAGSPEAQ